MRRWMGMQVLHAVHGENAVVPVGARSTCLPASPAYAFPPWTCAFMRWENRVCELLRDRSAWPGST